MCVLVVVVAVFVDNHLILTGNSILALPAQELPAGQKDVRNRHGHGTNAPQDGQGPVNTKVLVHGDSNDSHSTSRQVPHECDEGQCRGCIGLVRVDYVHVCRHEDADDTETNNDRGT